MTAQGVPSGRRRAAIVVAVIAALALVPGLVGWRLSAQLGSATTAADRFASLHKNSYVATGLCGALADELVAAKFVAPPRRAEAARQATRVLEAPSFTVAWKHIVSNAQQVAANGVATDQPYAVGLDLTPVVDRLRYSGIAKSNAQVDPVALGPTDTSPPARGFLGTAFVGSLVLTALAVAAAGVAFVMARGWRRPVIRAFGLAQVLWSLSVDVALVVLPGMLVGPPPTRAVQPLVDAGRSAVIGQLGLLVE